MKSDTTATALNFVLAVLVILGVVFALLSIKRTSQLRAININALNANLAILRAQSLANETAVYNTTAKNPELTRILQAIQTKPATK
jgi:uncharacterized protein (UPF0333 family)